MGLFFLSILLYFLIQKQIHMMLYTTWANWRSLSACIHVIICEVKE